MVNRAFPISFEYCLDEDRISVSLRADVEVHDEPTHYIVRNIRSFRQNNAPAIPDIRLKKHASVWVHIDSQKPTDLTRSIGKAIDAHELPKRQ